MPRPPPGNPRERGRGGEVGPRGIVEVKEFAQLAACVADHLAPTAARLAVLLA